MTEVVRGSIADRPWGLTFGQFGLRQVTGTLTVQALDGREYKVAFDQGAIVGAVSPQAADSATRVALTSNLIISTQVANLQKQIAARPTEDDADVVIDVCKLDAMRSLKLRRKLTTQRAARMFSIEIGSFVLDDQISISTSYDASVDVRAVIYQGARLNFTETRLVTELRDLGSHFMLGEHALESFDWFGFEDPDRPILDELAGGASVAEIEAKHRSIDPRQIQSVVYALVTYRQAHSVGDSGPARKVSRPGVAVSFKQAGGVVEIDRRRAPSEPVVRIEPAPTPPSSPLAASTPAAPMQVNVKGSAPHPAVQDPPRPMARASTSPPISARAPTPPFGRAPTPPPIDGASMGLPTGRAPTSPPATARAPTPSSPLPSPRLPAMTPKSRVPVQDESTPVTAARTMTLKGATTESRPPSDGSIGLPGIEEEPTASRNLVGTDRGPPPMPELANPRTTTAPIAGRSSYGSPPPMVSRTTSSEEPTMRRADAPRAPSPGPQTPRASSSNEALPRASSSSGSLPRASSSSGSLPRAASPSGSPPSTRASSPSGTPPSTRASSPSGSQSGSFPSVGGSQPNASARAASPSGSPPTGSHPTVSRAATPSSPPTSPLLRPKTPSTDPANSGSIPVSRTISSRTRTPSPAPSNIALARTISQSSGIPPTNHSEGSDRVRQSIDEAAESFKRGREALDANQPDVALAELTRAATLNPHEFEYTAILSAAQFLCATPAERTKTADKVRKMLGHAIQKSNDPESARFYLARMERLLDKKKEAVALLNQVLKAIPGHPGATAELQDIEDKAAEKAGLGGLFSRKKDK